MSQPRTEILATLLKIVLMQPHPNQNPGYAPGKYSCKMVIFIYNLNRYLTFEILNKIE